MSGRINQQTSSVLGTTNVGSGQTGVSSQSGVDTSAMQTGMGSNVQTGMGSNVAGSQKCGTLPLSQQTQGLDMLSSLIQDHRLIMSLYERYKQIGQTSSVMVEKKQVMHDFIRLLSIHDFIEADVFYPVIAQELPNGNVIRDHSLKEHQCIRNDLYRLDQMEENIGDATYDSLLDTVFNAFRKHVEEEERDFMPGLRNKLTVPRLHELGASLDRARSRAPTRPHPSAPDKGIGATIVGAMSKPIDAIRDAGRQFLGTGQRTDQS